jgi:hypothetical protein
MACHNFQLFMYAANLGSGYSGKQLCFTAARIAKAIPIGTAFTARPKGGGCAIFSALCHGQTSTPAPH